MKYRVTVFTMTQIVVYVIKRIVIQRVQNVAIHIRSKSYKEC